MAFDSPKVVVSAIVSVLDAVTATRATQLRPACRPDRRVPDIYDARCGIPI
jgi:hypothetical protein